MRVFVVCVCARTHGHVCVFHVFPMRFHVFPMRVLRLSNTFAFLHEHVRGVWIDFSLQLFLIFLGENSFITMGYLGLQNKNGAKLFLRPSLCSLVENYSCVKDWALGALGFRL